MRKWKAAVSLVGMTILIAVMIFFCTVSFPMGIEYFNSVVSLTDKSSDLGGTLIDGETYIGGSYSATYYPEGVISAREYEDNLAGYEKDDEKKEEYEGRYVAYGHALYLEKEEVCGGKEGTEPTEEFKTSFAKTVELLRARIERLHASGAKVQVYDDFSVRILLPAELNSQAYIYNNVSYTGELTVSYGTDSSSTVIMPAKSGEDISLYVKGASVRSVVGSSAVIVNLTKAGKKALRDATADADGSSNIIVKIGEDTIISLAVDEQLSTLGASSTAANTAEWATSVAATVETAIGDHGDTLALSVPELYTMPAAQGDLALILLYAAFGACMLGALIFFIVRYRVLAFAHLYSFLFFLLPMLLCIWAIGFLNIGIESALGLMLAGALLTVSNAVSFEYARKEYATGKTMTSSVKGGYKKCFWSLFDLHIAVALLAFMTFFVALTGLRVFAFTLALGTVFSGICSLGINRFAWAVMISFTARPGAVCNFKREETQDED